MDKATPVAKPEPIEEKTAAEQVYAVIHEALDAYAGHWSSLGEKADHAGTSVTDVQGTNDYDFMETIKAIAWSYFLYEAGRHLDPYLEQCISKDIVSALKRQDKANQRRMSRVSWDEPAVKEGQPLKQYLEDAESGAALREFLLVHFERGKELLNEYFASLAQYVQGVTADEYRRTVQQEVWKSVKAICLNIFVGIIAIGIMIMTPEYVPSYIIGIVVLIVFLILYIVKKQKKYLYQFFASLIFFACIYFLRFIASGVIILVYAALLIAFIIVMHRIERKVNQ